MIACDEGEEQSPQPAQQTQQPQPDQRMQNDGWPARAGSLPASVLDGKREPPKAGTDDARFTAGVVRFYEAILKEPIPEKMLRLIEEIAMQERKP